MTAEDAQPFPGQIVWRTFDDFSGDLSKTWRPQQRLTADDLWIYQEPHARTSVHSGTLEIVIDKFERAHDTIQGLDNAKHLLISRETTPVEEGGWFGVRARISARKLGAPGVDLRDGVVSLHAIDPDSGLIFDLFTTGERAAALYELMPYDAPGAFTYLVDDPIHTPLIEPESWHEYEILFDASKGMVRYSIDGIIIYTAQPAPFPRRLRLALGILTIHQIVGGRSTSCRGQGIVGRWRQVEIASSIGGQAN